MSLTILSGEQRLDEVRALFREYEASLGIDLGFQGFEAEVASIPAPYAEPRGGLYLASADGQTVGCVAFKPLSEETCELKRLYVRPAGRGKGVGRALCEQAISEAAHRGYLRMRLDTLARLESAVRLYRELGFVEIAPYYDNPLEEAVVYLERDLVTRACQTLLRPTL